jgi:L-fuconolactonase
MNAPQPGTGCFIDAHVHLWDASRREDILILQSQPSLAGRATPTALTAMLQASGAAGGIVVQAEPSLGHSHWLLDRSETLPGVTGVVAWVDPASPDLAATLDLLAARSSKLVGVRLMLNRMADPKLLLERPWIDGLRLVAARGLAIELLTPAPLLPVAARLAARLPEARLVIDHGGLPPADRAGLVAWQGDLRGFTRLGHVATKCSGLVEPIGPGYTPADVRARFAPLLDVFGPSRMMLASNWPVTDLAGGAARWFDVILPMVDALGDAGGAADIRFTTARNIFRSGPTPP